MPAVIEARRERELEVENQRAQDAALQAYLDQMGQLLLDKDRPLRQSKEGDEVRTLALARTSTVLGRLSSSYKSVIITFLAEAGLVQRVDNRGPIIGLSNFNLYGTDLSKADISGRGQRFTPSFYRSGPPIRVSTLWRSRRFQVGSPMV
jgi:hypothetical protein